MSEINHQPFIPSYVGLRHELVSLITSENRNIRVLDVGCSNGVNGEYLLNNKIASEVWGLEYSSEMAAVAKEKLTNVFVGDVEEMDFDVIFDGVTFDYMVFGDVLEHLRDPVKVLSKLENYLNPGGGVIISVPNMQHVSALWELIVKGDWPANERGIFDKTHLRVFTRKVLIRLVTSIGFEVSSLDRRFRYRDEIGSKFPFYGRLLKTIFPDFYTFQYIILARKPV